MHLWIRQTRSKKQILAAVAVCGLLLFNACVSPQEFLGSSSHESGNETVPFEGWTYDNDLAQTYTGPRAAVTEDGYYLEIAHILYYYDIAKDILFPLCTKESCTHSSNDCNAYVTKLAVEDGKVFSTCDYYILIFRDDKLYMFSKDDNAELFLNRYSSDLMNQEELARLTRATEEPRFLATGLESNLEYNGYYYYTICRYDEDRISSGDYDTVFTLCRVKLEQGAEPEELYSFDYVMDYSVEYMNSSGMRIFELNNDIYCIAATASRVFETDNPVQQRVIRYNEREGVELLWEYTGYEPANLLNASGPAPFSMSDSCLFSNGMLVYYSEDLPGLNSLNLLTKESRTIYQKPETADAYWQIGSVRSDGEYLYFIEIDRGDTFLVAVDTEGTEIRRHRFEYTDEYRKEIEEHNYRKEECVSGGIAITLSDGRYIMIRHADRLKGVYRDLSSEHVLSPFAREDGSCTGIGLIRTEDSLSGKEVEIKQIYSY